MVKRLTSNSPPWPDERPEAGHFRQGAGVVEGDLRHAEVRAAGAAEDFHGQRVPQPVQLRLAGTPRKLVQPQGNFADAGVGVCLEDETPRRR